ncbi:recombinase family protein [Kitasatospora sp. NPDC008050]|uniref:recombinase family protein n=1 Tax=Kitasatospora sp. NPDC008050 TaxID=3364021 RepID=UPI0036E685A7
MRAVSYIRQSKKREDDSQASPAAQRTKTEALITAKGWENSGHFEDIGKSGWDPNVNRPGFDETRPQLAARTLGVVPFFCWSVGRRGVGPSLGARTFGTLAPCARTPPRNSG